MRNLQPQAMGITASSTPTTVKLIAQITNYKLRMLKFSVANCSNF